MKIWILPVLLALMGACSHQARKVDCEEHLTAINPPTPIVKVTTVPPTLTATPKPETP
jgi:hypothetical protein